ncbi:MAG: hypothetical protein HQK58_10595 [Deltaproteobacteria bacterium]|nr:hypothetical protein [Deltaproteobacteria bacterium]
MKSSSSLVISGVSLAGLLYCICSAAGLTESWCFTQGCRVYKDYSFAGISLYWFGALAFAILSIFSLIRPGSKYLLAIASLFVLGDCFFLFFQLVLWPCVSCLLVAACLGSAYLALIRTQGRGMKTIFCVWLLLFMINVTFAAKESVSPWPIYGRPDSPIQVFYSATCPSCRKMIQDLMKRPDLLPRLALYPIAKNEEDYLQTAFLASLLKQGYPLWDAFTRHWQKEAPASLAFDRLLTSINLFRNKIALSRTGATTIPLIISSIPFGSEALSSSALPGCSAASKDHNEPCRDESAEALKNIFR